jgi:pyruvate/2-oxoglutarate dehydrogenase complex dihydrolipoamide dehydrogenase (E3) component
MSDWLASISALADSYGVNLILFASIYIGAIPVFWVGVAWIVRNLRKKLPITVPVLFTGLVTISSYLYVIAVGNNVPAWVYAVIGALIVYGMWALAMNIRSKRDALLEYDLIVIGGGAAGLTSSGIGASLGAKTIMIEAHRLGGDCTWTGCIPSKALLHLSTRADQRVDPLQRMREIREEVYHDADRPEIYEKMGVELAFGKASFIDKHTVKIVSDSGERVITGKKILIATGGRAAVPPIPGLESVPYLTNETLFELTETPKHLVIIGAGPIGIEMAQAFRNLGAEVSVIDMAARIMPRDHEALTAQLQAHLEGQGITFFLGQGIERADSRVDPSNGPTIRLKDGTEVSGSHLLIATGRKPNIESLNLNAAGIAHTPKGIGIDASCRTNVKHIFAIGDVTGVFAFTHMSEHTAKVAALTALLKFPMKTTPGLTPWVTYTSPELAHVGATEAELKQNGVDYVTYRFPYSKIDRAVTEEATLGDIRIYAKKSSGKIYGVDILGERAGDLIGIYALAMKNGLSLRNIADTIFPYPTYGLGARRAADQWYIQAQSPALIAWVQRIFGYRGPLPRKPGPDEVV